MREKAAPKDAGKTIHELRSRVYYLLKEIDQKRDRINELDNELGYYQAYLATKLRWFTELLSKGSTPCLKWFIQDLSYFFSRRKPFTWPPAEKS